MIRDPSDGSVREKEEPSVLSSPPMDDDKKPNLAKRLQASREWLRNYHKGKSCTGQ